MVYELSNDKDLASSVAALVAAVLLRDVESGAVLQSLRGQANKCGKPGRADAAKPNQANAGHSVNVNQDGPERRRQGRGQ